MTVLFHRGPERVPDPGQRRPTFADDLLDAPIPLGDRTARLGDVLRFCLDGDTSPFGNGASRSVIAEQCRTFLRGGLQAMRQPASATRWAEIALVLDDPLPERLLYRGIRILVDDLYRAGKLANFYFVHENPGLRLRFQAFGAEAPALQAQVRSFLADWPRRGLVRDLRDAPYEPQSALFGGPLSMAFAHRLFTLDSRAWLAVHAGAAADDADSVWAVSVGMLAAQLGALGIERSDTAVWRYVGVRLGQVQDGDSPLDPALARFAEDMRAVWGRPDWIRMVLSPEALAIVREFADPAATLIHNWYCAYFENARASVPPQEAAAQLILLHWNRARLPLSRQAAVARSLADRPEAAGE